MAEHRDIVLHGNPAPPTPRGTAAVHIFSAHLYCSQPVGWIGMPLGKEVGLDPWTLYYTETRLHPLKGAQQPSPILRAHVYCGQTVGWITMPRGRLIGLGPSDIVLDGNQAPPTQRGTAALPNF